MKYFKKLVGQKCYLSPISMDDVEKYTEWLNDIDITSNLALINQNISIYTEKEFLSNLLKTHCYAIVDLATDTLLGNVALVDVNHFYRTAELGIFIGFKDYLHKGYGEEAIRLILRYAFNYLNIRNVMLKVYAFNERAIQCYKKVGFKEIGRRRNAIIQNMQEYDLIFMDVLNDEIP